MFVQLVELISFRIKNKTKKKKMEDYIHKCNEDLFVGKKRYKIIKLRLWKIEKICTIIQGKSYILLEPPKIKTKLKNSS